MPKILAPRDAYGKVLVELGEIRKDIFVLNSDVAKATKTEEFGNRFPDRYINVGIAEQNMVGIAGGLAKTGFVPIMSTFACFAPGRCYDQIRQTISYSNLNVKIISTHPGLSVGMDGAIHQALDDIALMRELPNLVVLTPCDEVETKLAVKKAVEYNGPAYVRVGKKECPIVWRNDFQYEIGKAYTLLEGNDITIMAHGAMLPVAYEAGLDLRENGINARVINVSSIKPIDKEAIVRAAKETNKIITIEDHFIYGGLYSAVCEITSSMHPCLVKGIAVMNTFGESGEPEELYEKYGLTKENLIKTVIELC